MVPSTICANGELKSEGDLNPDTARWIVGVLAGDNQDRCLPLFTYILGMDDKSKDALVLGLQGSYCKTKNR